MTPLIQKLRSAGEAERTLAPASGLFDEAADEIEKLTAALAEREWREMETAPTNGQSVLLFCPRARDYGYARIRLTWRKDGLWQGANNTLWPPTHWMPLPPPPQEGGE